MPEVREAAEVYLAPCFRAIVGIGVEGLPMLVDLHQCRLLQEEFYLSMLAFDKGTLMKAVDELAETRGVPARTVVGLAVEMEKDPA